MSRSESGFTLVEMLLSVSIIGMLVGLSAPVYESFTRRNDLDLTAQTLEATLRRAAAYARLGNGDSAWSVAIQGSTFTLFRGTDFATRNTIYDESTTIPGTITPGGLAEIEFAKFTALPNTTGNITLASTTNDTRTITINAKGVVEY
jgi:prepilin-type N-terminal cleavage/methylation domain-containing protein